jgi:hypothetical protein
MSRLSNFMKSSDVQVLGKSEQKSINGSTYGCGSPTWEEIVNGEYERITYVRQCPLINFVGSDCVPGEIVTVLVSTNCY